MNTNIVYDREGNRLDLFLQYNHDTHNTLMYIGDNIDDAIEKLYKLTVEKNDRAINISSIEDERFTAVEEDVLVALKSSFKKRYSHVNVSLNKIDSTTQPPNYLQ